MKKIWIGISKNNKINNKINDKILVLSGGGTRWFYSIWILKWLEDCGIKKDIKAIFWVSIWAIVGSLWASWMMAQDIYDALLSLAITDFYDKDVFQKTWWALSNKKIKKILHKNLPSKFSQLKKKLYVWVVDTNTAEYMLLEKWNLPDSVLWSMSIPWVFPPVEYWNHMLVDGWLLDNFPVDKAKKIYPKNKIIWVELNKFKKNQKIKTIADNIVVSFEILLRGKTLEDIKKVDYLFYKPVPISILSLDKKKMKEAYESWYNDCMKMFK